MILQIEAPNPKQEQFFMARQLFVNYGGARGGGKTWAVKNKATLMALYYGGIKILVMRRRYNDLVDMFVRPLRTQLQGVARWKEKDKTFEFRNGSLILFGYLDSERDIDQYQGKEYDIVFIDEATQFSELEFQVLSACVRGVNDFPKRMYLTCNPGGRGHAWVKRLFIDRKYRDNENAENYAFIPATVEDNKALVEKDPKYLHQLDLLPEKMRRAWRYGDWDVLGGRFFSEFDEQLHVVQPFAIPASWTRYFAMDYGMDMLAGYWIAMDEAGNAYVYREVFRPGLIISQAASLIQLMTREEVQQYIAPPDMWNRRQESGQSVAEIFEESGIPLTKAGNDRVMGWYALREWLTPVLCEDGSEQPKLKIFSSCENLIESMKSLETSKRDPDDAAGEPHEYTHGPDALRYFVASRPMPMQLPQAADEGLGIDEQIFSLWEDF